MRANPIVKAVATAAVFAVIAGVGLGVRWCGQQDRGVEIRLHNSDTIALRSVEVAVTGKSYPVGDLAPGETASVWVDPTSESAVEISFATADREPKHVSVPSYIEPGYSGWIAIHLAAAEVREVENHVEL